VTSEKSRSANGFMDLFIYELFNDALSNSGEWKDLYYLFVNIPSRFFLLISPHVERYIFTVNCVCVCVYISFRSVYMYIYIFNSVLLTWGHYATNRKVAGSNPDEVIGFFD
jgi:hypothetical protein